MGRSFFAQRRLCCVGLVLVLVIGFASFPSQKASAAAILYVKPSALGSGDCSAWEHACTLQTALTNAVSGNEIWVMGGTYKPGTARAATFQLKTGVAVYGGFVGTEINRDDRDPEANTVTLSGDIGVVGTKSDNAYHVVTGADGALLDGVTISGGNANGVSPNDVGGGMVNTAASPTLNNVIFSNNSASWRGGGMFNQNSSPTLTGVTFIENRATSYDGGGMYNYNSSPILTDVVFSSNTAEYDGGGMYNWLGSLVLNNVSFDSNTASNGGGGGIYNYDCSASPSLANVTFTSNVAFGFGGGMHNVSCDPALTDVTFDGNFAWKWGAGMYNTNSDPTLNNVTFSGNTALENGGGMLNDTSNPVLVNVTFSGNTASQSNGGGMLNTNGNPSLTNVTFSGNSAGGKGGGLYNNASTPTLRNAIFWGNTAPTGPQISNASSTPVVTNSIVQAGYPGGTNILTSDPFLGALGDYGGNTQTLPLLPGSPAIDATSADCPEADQRGVSRGTTCDIGAFESQGFTLTKTDGDSQAALKGTAFAEPLVLGVSSAFGEPVDGGQVAFAAPTSGASITTPSFTLTIADGQVSQSVTANEIPGAYNVSASASGTVSTAFSLRNLPLIIYAKSGGLTSGDCGSWANACELSYALSNSVSRQEIWVKAGTYKPTDAIERTSTFQLKDGVAVYGGFNGAETYREARDSVLNIVILSGDIGRSGDNSDNTYHVVTGADDAILDGVTITGGYADGTTVSLNDNGGGFFNQGGSPSLKNITFSNNYAENAGGGLFVGSGNPTLINITFVSNTADWGGGMMDGGGATVTNATFSGNAAKEGGGLFISESSPTLSNVTFSGNTATDQGGAISIWSSNPVLRNGVFWGNTAPADAQIYNNAFSSPTISDSVVQDGFAGGTAIITADPLLGLLGDYGGSTQTFPLLPGSSAVDVGNPTYCTMGEDQRGVPYVGSCDIGAFESRGFTLTKSGGDDQRALVSLSFPQPLSVTVSSDFGEPVNGGKVTFSAPTSGASVSTAAFTLSIIDGQVSKSLMANEIAGVYNVYASASGAEAVAFELRNLPLIIFASQGGVSDGDCESWVNACELRYAISHSVSGQEIWVKAGTYKPTDVLDRTATFQLKDSVAIYGGFAGVETDREARDPGLNTVILSGDIGIQEDMADNSYHVLTGSDGAILDGVTVSEGNANGALGSSNDIGGGMFNDAGSLILNNIHFISNHADTAGGGFYNESGSPLLTDVTFSRNTCHQYGGGMTDSGSSTLIGFTFSNNSSQYGGGMTAYNDSSLINGTFSDNSASADGGGIYLWGSRSVLTNVTISENSADLGGGIAMDFGSPSISNTIIWGNSASIGSQIYNSGSSLTISNSVVQGGYSGGTAIISTDPQLGALGDYGGSTESIPLLAGSSAIDMGDDTNCPESDQRGVARPQGALCDIGAFEYVDVTPPTVTVFSLPVSSATHTIPVTAFNAIDDNRVTGYLITTSAEPPSADEVSWVGTQPVEFVVSSDGFYILYPWAKDASGNVSAEYGSPPSVIVGNVPPETQIDSHPADLSSDTTASFEFSSLNGTASFQCQLDRGGYAVCTSPKGYLGLSEGDHTFEVRAEDAVGNMDDSPASFTWKIDFTPPDTQIVSHPADPSSDTTASFAFGSPDSTATFQCQLNGGGYTTCTSPQTYLGLSEGEHTFDVKAVDIAGNTDATPASFSWTVDTNAPETQIDSHPDDPSIETTASFAFSSPDSTATFQCQLDGGGFNACISPQNYSGLIDGDHTFEVRAEGAEGNVDDSPASFTWAIDLTPPFVVSSLPADRISINASSVFFIVTFSEPVNGVDLDDFSLTFSSFTSADVVEVTGSASVYTVSVDTGRTIGTIRLDLPSSATITDLAGHSLDNLPYTSGQTYSSDKRVEYFFPLIFR